MRQISAKNKKAISEQEFYRKCCLADSSCDGRITIEHAIIYAGRQLDELWSLLPLCEFHHSVNRHQDGGAFNKEKNVWVALNRAQDFELAAISKAVDYFRMRKMLNEKYGVYLKG